LILGSVLRILLIEKFILGRLRLHWRLKRFNWLLRLRRRIHRLSRSRRYFTRACWVLIARKPLVITLFIFHAF
jgi:hypothetical protein